MLKIGDTVPATTLMEYSEVEGGGCSIGPNAVDVAKATAGKTIALFALPGAFTPPALQSMCLAIQRNLANLKPLAWTRFGA